MSSSQPQIVITGAGLITCLGLDRANTWRSVVRGRCGIGPLTAMEQPLDPDKGGGQAPDLPVDFEPDQPRQNRYLKWALTEALRDAGLAQSLGYPPERCGMVLGTTLHGMRSGGEFLRTDSLQGLHHFLAAGTAQQVCKRLAVRGVALTTCSACSSALASVALGVTLLQSGQADLVIAGGYDTISEYVYAGFNSLRLVATGPQKPFAVNREGMKVAEGYGVVILERAGDAQQREANVFATILGYGESSDTHHITQPHPQGHGAARAITQAMAQAGLTPKDIGLISAHATATPDNDAAEYAAFSNVFQDQLSATPVVGFKGHVGHTLGGAGAVELILAAMAMREKLVPPTPNVRGQVEFSDLRLVTADQAQPSEIGATLNTSLGFGGANACMILGQPSKSMGHTKSSEPTPKHPCVTENEVLITGIGVVAPGCMGNEAFIRRLECDGRPGVDRDLGAISDEDLAQWINARRSRRMSQLVKLTLGATTMAYRDAGIDPSSDWGESCSGFLGTMNGSINYCERYYRQVVEEGVDAANPILFAEGVPNAPSAHLSLAMGIKGSCQTIIGSRTAGLDALSLAAMRITSGQWDRAIVGAADEYSPLVVRACQHFGWGTPKGGAENGLFFGEGAVILILESAALANRRGALAHGRVQSTACASGLGCVTGQTLAQAGRSLDRLGQPRFVIGSASGSGFDRLELATLLAGRTQGPTASSPLVWSSIYGHVAEMFSVGPLGALAAVLLTGRMPKLLGRTPKTIGTIQPATGNEQAQTFAVLCSDHTGTVSGVCAARASDRPVPT